MLFFCFGGRIIVCRIIPGLEAYCSNLLSGFILITWSKTPQSNKKNIPAYSESWAKRYCTGYITFKYACEKLGFSSMHCFTDKNIWGSNAIPSYNQKRWGSSNAIPSYNQKRWFLIHVCVSLFASDLLYFWCKQNIRLFDSILYQLCVYGVVNEIWMLNEKE